MSRAERWIRQDKKDEGDNSRLDRSRSSGEAGGRSLLRAGGGQASLARLAFSRHSRPHGRPPSHPPPARSRPSRLVDLGPADDDAASTPSLGKLLVRADGPGRATLPDVSGRRAIRNLGNIVHGGAILTFIDMALFAGGMLAGANVMPLGDARSFDALPLARPDRRAARRRGRAAARDQAARFMRRQGRPGGGAGRRLLGALRKASRIRDRGRRALPGAGRGRRAAARSGPGARGGGARPARRRARPKAAAGAGLLGLFGTGRAAARRRLSVGRGRARQIDADGPRLRGDPARAQAPRPFPRIHARSARAAARRAGEGGGRPDPAGRRGDRRGGRTALLRRDGDQQRRRRDDPVAAVRAAARGGRHRDHHLEPAARATSISAASTASCSCPSST